MNARPQDEAAPDQPRWLSEEEREAWLSLAAIMFRVPGDLEGQLQRDSDLGFVEYMVLAMLSEAPRQQLSMSRLSAQTNTRLARLSRVVKRLEAHDYVRRFTSQRDRRVNICHLEPAGLAAVRRAAPGHVEQVRHLVFDRLTRRQVSQLAKIGESLMGGKPSAVIAAQLAQGSVAEEEPVPGEEAVPVDGPVPVEEPES